MILGQIAHGFCWAIRRQDDPDSIDSHSKWIEVFPTKLSTSATVIELSRTLFAQLGVPEVVVTDNGSCFVSVEFETFLLKNGIKHITSAPYHPSTNGLAERAVQIVKQGLKKRKGGKHEDEIGQSDDSLSCFAPEYTR